MFTSGEKQLHWSQRIAFVRHNFHSARRNGDYTFFKTLQAHAFVQGTDYVATLTTSLGNEADAVLSTLDGLNAGIAFVFQDAFKTVCDSLKELMRGADADKESIKAQLAVDIVQQIQRIDFAIDRIINSAIALVQLQPTECQADVACAWILGATIMSDAMSVCMHEFDNIENCVGDFIRLEHSWSQVQASTEAATIALRGVLNLMANDETPEDIHRSSISSTGSSTQSAMGMLRKFSTVLGTPFQMSQPPPPYKKYRGGSSASHSGLSSIALPTSPSLLRNSFAHAVPIKMPKTPRSSTSTTASFDHTPLTTIPGTPGIVNEAFRFDLPSSPYTKNDHLADMGPGPDTKDHYVQPKM